MLCILCCRYICFLSYSWQFTRIRQHCRPVLRDKRWTMLFVTQARRERTYVVVAAHILVGTDGRRHVLHVFFIGWRDDWLRPDDFVHLVCSDFDALLFSDAVVSLVFQDLLHVIRLRWTNVAFRWWERLLSIARLRWILGNVQAQDLLELRLLAQCSNLIHIRFDLIVADNDVLLRLYLVVFWHGHKMQIWEFLKFFVDDLDLLAFAVNAHFLEWFVHFEVIGWKLTHQLIFTILHSLPFSEFLLASFVDGRLGGALVLMRQHRLHTWRVEASELLLLTINGGRLQFGLACFLATFRRGTIFVYLVSNKNLVLAHWVFVILLWCCSDHFQLFCDGRNWLAASQLGLRWFLEVFCWRFVELFYRWFLEIAGGLVVEVGHQIPPRRRIPRKVLW